MKKRILGWFDVDKIGLSKLVQLRAKALLIFELVQNAWDQRVTRVDVEFRRIPNQSAAIIAVTDDDPNGFQDLRHAFTLFAESPKKQRPRETWAVQYWREAGIGGVQLRAYNHYHRVRRISAGWKPEDSSEGPRCRERVLWRTPGHAGRVS